MRRSISRCTAIGWRAAAAVALAAAGASIRPALAQSAGEWSGSEQLWRATCRYCHDGKVATELRGAGLAPQAIVTAVRTGPKAMPSFTASQISDQELEQLAQWVSSQKAPASAPADRATRTPRHGSRQRGR